MIPELDTGTLIAGIVLLALMNVVYKAIGPVLLGDRRLPAAADRVLRAVGQGLLGALVIVTLLGVGWDSFDWTMLPGIGGAIALRLWAGQSHLVCALVAVAVTAAVRLVA
ncbi:MAG TPA: AzlD domain-containing protein [Thermomicrobiales bacterium]|jgi:branched-subunit amino acid transport protein|nr:AzlD domain-containing protein [Thermomicrobiales bacterium]